MSADPRVSIHPDSSVLMAAIDWLNFDPIVLVSYPDAATPRAGSRP